MRVHVISQRAGLACLRLSILVSLCICTDVHDDTNDEGCVPQCAASHCEITLVHL